MARGYFTDTVIAKRMTFAEYLRAAYMDSGFKTQKELAQALDIEEARLSRVMKGTDQYAAFNVENCLRLAHFSGRPAGEVLRAAGKSDVADLLDALYPKATKAVPPREHKLLTFFRELPDEKQGLASDLVRALAETVEKRQSS